MPSIIAQVQTGLCYDSCLKVGGKMTTKVSIGLTTWSEHPALIDGKQRPVKLSEYAAWLPTVEIDTFFYALPKIATVVNWLHQVPSSFSFIIKAHQAMTLHDQGSSLDAGSLPQLFDQYRQSIMPLVAAGQLKTILFQFPPYFEPSIKHIEYFHRIREWLPNLPIAVELRNRQWFSKAAVDSLTSYCRDLNFTLVAADEPNVGIASVPFLVSATNPDLVLMRLHGRNAKGWATQGPSWRKTRTLYRYSSDELHRLAKVVQQTSKKAREVCVVFNNNSGKDAAPNALSLAKILDLHFSGLAKRPPEQLNLF